MLSRLFSKRTARSLGAPVPRGVVLDAETLELVAELPAGGMHGEIAAAPDGVWITTPDRSSVSHVDPDGHERVRVDLPDRPTHLAVQGECPVVLCDRGRLVRVDPVGGRITDDVRVPDEASAVVAAPRAVWLLVAGDMDRDGMRLVLTQLDPDTLAVVREVEVGRSRFFGDLRLHGGTVSVLLETAPGSMGHVTLDAVTGEPAATPDELAQVRGIGERDGVRWTRDRLTVRKTDVASGRELASTELDGPRAASFVLAHGRIWAVTFRAASRPDNEDTD